MRTILLMVVMVLMLLTIPMPEGVDVESDDALPVMYGLCPSSEICGEAERREVAIPIGGHLEDLLQLNICDAIAYNGQAVTGPGVRPRPA